uniref:hypothetical protein n=1 Tax=Streptococcus anginosus TaxID=1328 RepID=UPI002EDAF3CB
DLGLGLKQILAALCSNGMSRNVQGVRAPVLCRILSVSSRYPLSFFQVCKSSHKQTSVAVL